MQYDVIHTTEYDYSESVAVSHHVARLSPRQLPHQECLRHELPIEPAPAGDEHGRLLRQRRDDLRDAGRAQAARHSRAQHRGRDRSDAAAPGDTPPWEAAADRAALPFDAVEFVFDSTESRSAWTVEPYARASFPPGRPLLDAVLELTARIHDEFTFDPKATTVATPLTEVFASRRGVCQDFARLEIACLRSLGIPARYVSGYMETVPPPGARRLIGADASHAWLTVYCPGIGWIPVDPTNNLLPSDTHVTLAWGRDYNDVSPIHGVILGGGAHALRVRVDVVRLA